MMQGWELWEVALFAHIMGIGAGLKLAHWLVRDNRSRWRREALKQARAEMLWQQRQAKNG